MLSTRLKMRSHPAHSHTTPGLCLASCRARSFLLEKPPPLACEQAGYRQKKLLVWRLWCLRRSQPRVKLARDVQPGYAHDHDPSALTKPYRFRSSWPGDEGVRQCPTVVAGDTMDEAGEVEAELLPAEALRGDWVGVARPAVMMVVLSGPWWKGLSVGSARLMGEPSMS